MRNGTNRGALADPSRLRPRDDDDDEFIRVVIEPPTVHDANPRSVSDMLRTPAVEAGSKVLQRVVRQS